MAKATEQNVDKAVDSIQQRLTSYACGLKYEALSDEAIHTAKVRVIDILGCLFAGFFGEPCQISRNLATRMATLEGATVLGTRMRTTPDMAAFVNGTTARFAEMMDAYHWPGSYHGHPSDVVMATFAAAENAQASGREFITGVVLAYEVFCRVCDIFKNEGFDHVNFAVIGTAVAAGKLLHLTPEQLSHCISMAVVPNNMLRQARMSHHSMWKGTATGQAGRAGVFAAMLAQEGMEGPHLPYEGKCGWCDHVARERFSLDTWGGSDTRFKIMDVEIKNRSSSGVTIASVLAAEKIAPLNVKDVKQIIVEVHKRAKDRGATGDQRWNPDTRETADGSIPYVVAATLMDGTVTPRSYNDAHLWNPQLRALIQKVEVVDNDEFTRLYYKIPQEHHTRVTVVTQSGERLVGSTGGDADDLASAKTDASVADKFRTLSEEVLGAKRVNDILDRLWHLEDMQNVAELPHSLVIT